MALIDVDIEYVKNKIDTALDSILDLIEIFDLAVLRRLDAIILSPGFKRVASLDTEYAKNIIAKVLQQIPELDNKIAELEAELDSNRDQLNEFEINSLTEDIEHLKEAKTSIIRSVMCSPALSEIYNFDPHYVLDKFDEVMDIVEETDFSDLKFAYLNIEAFCQSPGILDIAQSNPDYVLAMLEKVLEVSEKFSHLEYNGFDNLHDERIPSGLLPSNFGNQKPMEFLMLRAIAKGEVLKGLFEYCKSNPVNEDLSSRLARLIIQLPFKQMDQEMLGNVANWVDNNELAIAQKILGVAERLPLVATQPSSWGSASNVRTIFQNRTRQKRGGLDQIELLKVQAIFSLAGLAMPQFTELLGEPTGLAPVSSPIALK